MKNVRTPRLVLMTGLAAASLGLAACDPTTTGSSSSAYYDAVMWNDYYYGYPRPPRPPSPPPAKPVPPIAKPPMVKPPIHRPPVARPLPGRVR